MSPDERAILTMSARQLVKNPPAMWERCKIEIEVGEELLIAIDAHIFAHHSRTVGLDQQYGVPDCCAHVNDPHGRSAILKVRCTNSTRGLLKEGRIRLAMG